MLLSAILLFTGVALMAGAGTFHKVQPESWWDFASSLIGGILVLLGAALMTGD